jgi:hypothetical protein
MDGSPPTPLVAAVGLVAFATDRVRRLPQTLDEARRAAHRRYDELALHGRDVLAGHVPGVAAGHAPAAEPPAGPGVEPPAGPGVEPAGPGVEPFTGTRAEQSAGTSAAEAPVNEPPVAPTPIGLTEPIVLPEDVQDDVAQLTPGAELAHADLPLPDFDHQTVPQLRGRLRSLALVELVQLRDYEQAHAARLPVLTLLDNRIAKLLENTAQ